MNDAWIAFGLLLIGIVMGVVLTAWLFRRREMTSHDAIRAVLKSEMAEAYAARGDIERARIVRAYEGKIQNLESEHQAALDHARRSSVNQSRAVLKGKMAEQVAPLLPGFTYWPADARFLGDPIDYVIFDGYSACKDDLTDGRDIEIVMLDIKHGKSVLSREQRRIADAIMAGRVRFEVVRVLANGTVRSRVWQTPAAQQPRWTEEDIDEKHYPRS